MLQNWSSIVDWFQVDAVNCIVTLTMSIVVILISLILHECAHGWMALRCGDPTAKYLGRLTLNPLKHLDPIGTLCMIFAGFGWAKPVPVNPRNFESYRRDDFLVSIAGIVTNLMLFIMCALLAVMLNTAIWKQSIEMMGVEFDAMAMLQNYTGFTVNAEGLVNPFASGANMAIYITYGQSFDWVAPFCNVPWLLYVQRFLLMMARTNLTLAIFNFLPIPPLDGFHILNDTILGGRLRLNPQVFRIAQFALIVLLFSTDFIDSILIGGCELIGGSVIRTFLMLTGQM